MIRRLFCLLGFHKWEQHGCCHRTCWLCGAQQKWFMGRWETMRKAEWK